jgi:alpha-1,6-mannosyltransferase
MTLRTLHFTNAWHASSGGIGTFYRALLRTADETGWQARLVVPSDATRFESTGSVTGIYHVRAPRAPFSPAYRVLYPHTYLLPNSPILQILAAERPHLVEICDKYTLPYLGGLLRVGALGKAAGRPAVVALSCERADETLAVYSGAGVLARMFAPAYMKYLYFPLSDHHIAVSRHVAEELEPASRGHKVSRGVWIRGMGVDAGHFHPRRKNAAIRRELATQAGASEDAVLLLYAGRLAPEKNLPLLLRLLTALRTSPGEYKLLIAGNGPSQEWFLKEGRRLHGGAVVYLGHIAARDRLADLMANVDVFVHPNPGEPYGIAPLEAMAGGTPLVAPDSGGVCTYANPDNAWLVPATGGAFALAVWSILHDPAERERRTQRARATAERLHWPEVCAAFHSLYQDLRARIRGSGETLTEPAFYSTPGNWLGRETASETSSGENVS